MKSHPLDEARQLALDLYNNGHRINKRGGLMDPTKRLVPSEIAETFGVTMGRASQAVHMVNLWSLNPKMVGTIDRI